MADVHSRIAELRVIPMIAIDDVDKAVPLADALIEGRLPIVEITFRTEPGQAAIRTIAERRPDCLLGAGTILTVDQLKAARDAGATFGVSPGFNPKVVAEAVRMGFAFSPGVMTPSDVEAALDVGLDVLKYFPAEAAGGVKMLKSLAGPYRHTGVKFIPTGGINTENFVEYLALDVVLAVGGSWIARREDIAAGNWDRIRANCEAIRAALGAS
ncbi:MAG: bifunctional 4-hydroxy-2-oxoglutarate aldolase/2-dehydro-3-deoxy-phosphogluconate aldolase [Phycisphaerae bacterium]